MISARLTHHFDAVAVEYLPAPEPKTCDGSQLHPEEVFAALRDEQASDTAYVVESTSTKSSWWRQMDLRRPGSYYFPAAGGLGFGLPAAVGVALAQPDRPVVGVIGDGSSMYAIQALWSAAHYEVGVLLIVMANGRYAVMDGLARAQNATSAWPAFGSIDIAGISRLLGCPAINVSTHDELLATFDEVLPDLGSRREPLLIEVALGG